MAENETLDLWDRHSGRWRQLLRKIEQGRPSQDIADETLRCLRKTFQNLIDLFSRQGLPLSGLLDAAQRNDDTLHPLVRRCREGRDYAELIEQLASNHHDRKALLRAVMWGTVDRFLSQIKLKLLGRAEWPDTARFRILESEIREAMETDLDQLADRVAERPDVKPRMPARSAEQKTQDGEELMRTSLLLGRSGTHG